MEVPPGEGERRAQRGYVPQYNLGAALVYEALASGRLRWIGVADRRAGSFDDIVLGLTEGIKAYQVKTSRDPEPFSIDTLLLGAENLLGRMAEARQRIADSSPKVDIETIYVCDDYPRTNDSIGNPDSAISSAAYLRAHEAHRLSWGMPEWRNSLYWPFVERVQRRSGLNDQEFEVMWRNTLFRTGGRGRLAGIDSPTAEDRRRIGEIAALLPQLVADSADRDRWSVDQLLERLQWRSPFGLRHAHVFPVDALYESNEKTQKELSDSLAAKTSGYISLVGPPGSGKSTLLAAGLLPTPRAHIVRYLAFVPGTGQGLGRGEAFDFLHDVVKQLKQHRLGRQIIPGSELPELRKQLELIFLEASERFQTEGTRVIIVVDGLDHVPREEKPQHSFLREFPLPDSLPDGVIIILGTQRLDLADIPKSVADQAREPGRQINIAPLTRLAVNRLAELAGVPDDVNRDALYERTEGHPLSARYIIDGLLRAPTPEKRKDWLTNGPAYGGDVDVFYKRAWHDLEGNPEAERGLAYLALAEGSISPAGLDLMIGPHVTDALWDAAGHLLRRDRAKNWSVFHNSFRLFLRAQTSLRHGLPDQDQVRSRYIELAEMASKAENRDGQRWMELRYRARASENNKVVALAAPERFRKQFTEGRNPSDIDADIRLCFQAAKILRNAQLALDLILATHELNMRVEALGDDLFSAFIYLGDLEAAKSVLDAARTALTAGKGFELVEAFLEAGEPEEARELFDALEPIDKLLGSEQLQMQQGSDGLEEWAEVALVFREPKQVLASLSRLRGPDDPFRTNADIDSYKKRLKMLVAHGQLRRNPELNPSELIALLEIDQSDEATVFYLAARSAFESQNKALTAERLQACSQRVADLSSSQRRELSRMAFSMERLALSRSFIDGIEAPTLELGEFNYNDEDLRFASRQVILHASLRSRLGISADRGKRPKSNLFAIYQSRLEWLGRVLGECVLKPAQPPFSVSDFEALLDFLQRAKGDDQPDFERGSIDRVMDEAIVAMVDTAALAGNETLLRFSELMDLRMANSQRGLGSSSVRRAYAKAVFRHDRDAEAAVKRIHYEAGSEETPAIAFSEAALTAQALGSIGLMDEAFGVLKAMHEEGVGYSKRAKHDPQYLLWEDFLKRANEQDPMGRSHRVMFVGRLISGLADTEGSGAAQRIIGALLEESARADSKTAASVVDLSEKCDLSNWAEIVWTLALGIAKAHPSLPDISAIVIGRLGVPFDTELDRASLIGLIRTAPPNRLEAVVRRIVDALEVDAPVESRILALESVVEAAAEQGLEYGAEALNRWRAELPPPKSGNSPEDPFFLLRSLDEIAALLAKVRDTSDAFGARSAFLKVLPHTNYHSAKALFEQEDILNKSEEVVDGFARFAIAKGRPEDATKLLPTLKHLANERGSWGGFSGKAKQRYFLLRQALGDKNTSSEAFDAFLDDLANGREFINYMLPELGRLFALISPTVSWVVAWERLAQHLSQFREYKHGKEISYRQDIPFGAENTIADLLFRSVETTSSPLIKMARTAAVEIGFNENGASIVEALLQRLWQRGGSYALEAAQIAWECRSVEALRNCLTDLVPFMAVSDDIGIRRTGMRIAEEQKLAISYKRAEFPATYRLALPGNPALEKFEPPSGMSTSSSGLFTEDVSTWTWVLETPLRVTSKASGIKISNLRYRVAELMRRNGGAAAFGPDAVKNQMLKLRRLSLHTPYWKLMSSAAFQATREVVGELVAAEAIDPRAVPLISMEAGAYSAIIPTRPPMKRQTGICSVNIPEIFSLDDSQKWIEAVDEDLVPPQVEGFVVLAAIATHKRSFREESWRAEQYFGPFIETATNELSTHLRHFPDAFVIDEIELRNRDESLGTIVYLNPTISGSITTKTPVLNPLIARELGWRSDPTDAVSFFDNEGNKVAYTFYWRDGGIVSHDTDHSVHRHGYAVIVRSDQWSFLNGYVAKEYELRAWRRVQRSMKDAPIMRSGRRKEGVPSPTP